MGEDGQPERDRSDKYEFSFLANDLRWRREVTDPIEVALWLAETPCGPLYKRHISPDRELAAAVASWSAEHAS